MEKIKTLMAAAIIAGAAAMQAVSQTSPVATPELGARQDAEAVNGIISTWPEAAQRAARVTIEKYGQPHEATSGVLLWNNNGVWKRTLVFREEVPHNFPTRHADVIQQFIDYRVRPGGDRLGKLSRYNGSIMVDRTKGELSARSESEEMNLLALNLANDIIAGKKNVEQARRFHARTAALQLSGKAQAYAERLLFDVPMADAADPDQPVVEETRETPAGLP